MALAIRNNELYNNNKKWKTYRVLNDELNKVYKILIDDDDALYIKETNRPEKNDPIIDDVTGLRYFIAIKNINDEDDVYDAMLYLDSYDCVDMCETTKNNNDLLNEIKVMIENKTLNDDIELEITQNGWKII